MICDVGLHERFGTKAFPFRGSESRCKCPTGAAVFRAGHPELFGPRVLSKPGAFLVGWSYIAGSGFGCGLVFYMVMALTFESKLWCKAAERAALGAHFA